MPDSTTVWTLAAGPMIIHPGTAFPNSTRRSTPHNVQKAHIVIYWIVYRDPRQPDQTGLIWKQKKSRWSQMMDPWKRGLGFPCLSEESERWSVGPWAPARFLLSRDERIISRNLMLKCILIGQFLSLCSFFLFVSIDVSKPVEFPRFSLPVRLLMYLVHLDLIMQLS